MTNQSEERREISLQQLGRIISDYVSTRSTSFIGSFNSLPLAKPQIDTEAVKEVCEAFLDEFRDEDNDDLECVWCDATSNDDRIFSHYDSCMIQKARKLLAQLNTLEGETR